MRLDHIGIEVNDLYKMELFYRKHFDFTCSYRYVSKNQTGLRTSILEKDGLRIELLERSGSSLKDQRTFHLAFYADNVEEEYARLKNFSSLRINPPRITGDGMMEIEVFDPEGNTIEISKRMKDEPAYSIKGVIFDLDGTLIDSEQNYYIADKKLLEAYNITFSEEDKKRFIGGGNLDMMVELRRMFNISETAEEMVAKKNKIYLEIAEKNTKVYPEMLKFLLMLKERGYPTAIASGSSPVIIDRLVDILDLRKYFDAIVSAEEVGKGKPRPDIFFEAAKRLGIEPQHVAVIEDSMYGIEAAKRAFMPCVAVPYIIEDPMPDSFMMADLYYPRGMVEFSAERTFEWIKKFEKNS